VDIQETTRRRIANRLKIARGFAGLSQSQVAKMLDLHRPTISEIEADRRKVSADELSRFSQIYKVSIDWLIGEELETQDEHLDRINLAARELSKLKQEDFDRLIELLITLRKSPGQ
jgi:transcriptional regulator with XRE-family HTH domain